MARRPAALCPGPRRAPGVPRPEPDPGAERDPAPPRLAAARGARRAVARGAAPALRDRGPDLVLSALPHRRRRRGPARGLPRPAVLAARLRRADRRGCERATATTWRSSSWRCRASGAATSRPRPRSTSGRAFAAAARRSARRWTRTSRPTPRPTLRAGEERYRLLRRALAGELGSSDRRDAEGSRAARAWAARASRPARSGSWSRSRRPSRSTRSATPTSPSPAPSRTARSWPSSRTSCSRGCCSGCS